MAISKLVLTGFISSLFLSACSTTIGANMGADHTIAVQEAMNKQIVSSAALTGAPILDPALTAAAIQRHLDGTVKEIEDDDGGFTSDK